MFPLRFFGAAFLRGISFFPCPIEVFAEAHLGFPQTPLFSRGLLRFPSSGPSVAFWPKLSCRFFPFAEVRRSGGRLARAKTSGRPVISDPAIWHDLCRMKSTIFYTLFFSALSRPGPLLFCKAIMAGFIRIFHALTKRHRNLGVCIFRDGVLFGGSDFACTCLGFFLRGLS